MFLTAIWLLSVIGWFIVTITVGWFGWWSFGSFVTIIVFTIPVIYFGLAPRNLNFTLIQDGYAKMIGAAGSFIRGITSSRDYVIDDRSNVILIGGKNIDGRFVWIKDREVVSKGTSGAKRYKCRYLFGGLRFCGIYPFREILKYKFRWSHLHEDGSMSQHSEDDLDGVLLKTDLYIVDLPLTSKKATQDIDGVPLGIQVVLPIRIANIYEAFFVYRRWLSIINGVVESTLRRFIARYRYKEDLIDMVAGSGIEEKQLDKGIIDEKLKVKVGADLRDQYWEELTERIQERAVEEGSKAEKSGNATFAFGVEIQKTGFGILNIEPGADYVRLITAKYQADREKEVRVVKAEAERDARAEEIASTLIRMLANLTGKTPEEIQQRIYGSKGKGKLFEKFMDIATDLLQRELAAKTNSLRDIRIGGPGSEGLQGILAPFIPFFEKASSTEKKKSQKEEKKESQKEAV